MFTKKIAYFLVISLLFSVSGFAHGAPDDNRYLVVSNSGFWKKSFGVRHEFNNGFTTNLNDWQLRVAKVFGVDVVPVMEFYILPSEVLGQVTQGDVADEISSGPEEDVSKKPPGTPGGGNGGGDTTTPERIVPTEQLTWGVRAVYGEDPLLTSTSGGSGVNVAVLDTGVFKDHLDLVNRVSQCKDFTQRKSSVIDGKCDDKNGHGTHVAGVIAADGGADGLGIFGIAPEANLYAYKVCGNNGSCWSDDIAIAIMTAADEGANIINMSLGSDSQSSLIRDAIDYAVARDVLVIAAAGNDGDAFGSIDYPGADPDVMAVGAFDVTDAITGWSSRGINSNTTPYHSDEKDIEVVAPGAIIESTWKDGGYVILSGTSMATPHMVGLAAKLWQTDELDPDSATRTLLHGFAEDFNVVGDDDASGWGFPHL